MRSRLVFVPTLLGLCCCSTSGDVNTSIAESSASGTTVHATPPRSPATRALPPATVEFIDKTFDLTNPVRAEELRTFVERHGGDPELVDVAFDQGSLRVETADLTVCFQYPDTEPAPAPGHALYANVNNQDSCPE